MMSAALEVMRPAMVICSLAMSHYELQVLAKRTPKVLDISKCVAHCASKAREDEVHATQPHTMAQAGMLLDDLQTCPKALHELW